MLTFSCSFDDSEEKTGDESSDSDIFPLICPVFSSFQKVFEYKHCPLMSGSTNESEKDDFSTLSKLVLDWSFSSFNEHLLLVS